MSNFRGRESTQLHIITSLRIPFLVNCISSMSRQFADEKWHSIFTAVLQIAFLECQPCVRELGNMITLDLKYVGGQLAIRLPKYHATRWNDIRLVCYCTLQIHVY